MVQSELSIILKNVEYIFSDVATRDCKCICGLAKRSKEGGQAIFIFSLFLGKTVLNNIFAEF